MDLNAILAQEVKPYAGKMLNGYAYLTVSDDGNVYTVVSVAQIKSERVTHLSLLARVVGNTIIIEHDDSSEPLVDALVRTGIPRDQIILAYAGEPVPASV